MIASLGSLDNTIDVLRLALSFYERCNKRTSARMPFTAPRPDEHEVFRLVMGAIRPVNNVAFDIQGALSQNATFRDRQFSLGFTVPRCAIVPHTPHPPSAPDCMERFRYSEFDFGDCLDLIFDAVINKRG